MRKLYIRHIDCGHTRPTSLNYIFGNGQEKPKVGDSCYCRECFVEGKVTKVEEADSNTAKAFDDFRKNFESKEDKR